MKKINKATDENKRISGWVAATFFLLIFIVGTQLTMAWPLRAAIIILSGLVLWSAYEILTSMPSW